MEWAGAVNSASNFKIRRAEITSTITLWIVQLEVQLLVNRIIVNGLNPEVSVVDIVLSFG